MDVEALLAIEEIEIALITPTFDRVDYENDWIIDSGCLSQMTSGITTSKSQSWNCFISGSFMPQRST